jgi:ATP-dependent Clp protease ATP-binding subunit ClpA
VAEIRYGSIVQHEQNIAALQKKLQAVQKDMSLLREEVTEEEIAAIVSRWTGVPVTLCSKVKKRTSAYGVNTRAQGRGAG